jgi:hypothetical protein
MLRVLEVLCSDLGPKTSCPDEIFCGYFSNWENAEIVSHTYSMNHSFHIPSGSLFTDYSVRQLCKPSVENFYKISE